MTLRPLVDFDVTPDMTFLIPLAREHELFSDFELNQIVHELTIAMYVYNEDPSYALDPMPDNTGSACLPSAYHNTLVGRVLAEVDILGKSALMGLLMPQPTRCAVASKLRGNPITADDLGNTEGNRLWQLYTANGAEPVREVWPARCLPSRRCRANGTGPTSRRDHRRYVCLYRGPSQLYASGGGDPLRLRPRHSHQVTAQATLRSQPKGAAVASGGQRIDCQGPARSDDGTSSDA